MLGLSKTGCSTGLQASHFLLRLSVCYCRLSFAGRARSDVTCAREVDMALTQATLAANFIFCLMRILSYLRVNPNISQLTDTFMKCRQTFAQV